MISLARLCEPESLSFEVRGGHIAGKVSQEKAQMKCRSLDKRARLGDFVTGTLYYLLYILPGGDRGGTVVKVLCYKSEGRWFDPSWCHWNFSLT